MSDVIDAMVRQITTSPGTSITELEGIAEAHGINTTGDVTIEMFPNGVLWAGTSPAFVDLLDDLRRTGQVEMHPLEPDAARMIYAFDGGKIPTLPIAERPPQDPHRGYAQPRWLAVTFGPKEHA